MADVPVDVAVAATGWEISGKNSLQTHMSNVMVIYQQAHRKIERQH